MPRIRRYEKNFTYRNGLCMRGEYTVAHLGACAKYRRAFLKKNKYIYCERCEVNQNSKKALRFEVHHIIFASERPKHKNLHNPKNLILLCIGCHNELHKHKFLRNDLVVKRGLVELFDNQILIKGRVNKTN